MLDLNFQCSFNSINILSTNFFVFTNENLIYKYPIVFENGAFHEGIIDNINANNPNTINAVKHFLIITC